MREVNILTLSTDITVVLICNLTLIVVFFRSKTMLFVNNKIIFTTILVINLISLVYTKVYVRIRARETNFSEFKSSELVNYQKNDKSLLPLVINTWAFTRATEKAWQHMWLRKKDPVETVEYGCSECEFDQCDFTVGYGGSPDENGETTLDAMIMDGNAMNVGAVGGLRRVKEAARLAKHVLQFTKHSILVGELATDFARQMQFTVEPLSTNKSTEVWKKWKFEHCQPNFWQNVKPDPEVSCGPYEPLDEDERDTRRPFHKPSDEGHFNEKSHDTISMIAIDRIARVAVGTSSNGANHKIPGRVGDAPIPGAGGYADATVGAAVATGDGDVMMRFLPSFLAVEDMRRGAPPADAAEAAVNRIAKYYPKFFGAVIAANMMGEYGAACNGMKEFPFSVINPRLKKVTVKRISCFNSD